MTAWRDFERDEVSRRRFPALDPEPPPPPWWRRLLVPACVLAGVAVVVTAVRWLPSVFAGSPGRAGRRPGAPGTGSRRARRSGRAAGSSSSPRPANLALANPDGSHLARASSLGVVGNAVGASPDDRYLSLLNGQVISVRRRSRAGQLPGQGPAQQQ